jgi:hypothetical protein
MPLWHAGLYLITTLHVRDRLNDKDDFLFTNHLKKGAMREMEN